MFSYAARRRRRWRRRRRLAYLAVAGLALTIAAQHAAHPHQPAIPPQARPAAHAHRSTPPARVVSAKGLHWLDFHGIQLPVSATAGPHHLRNALARGFTDTPSGTVLAAVNIAVRTAAQWGPRIFTAVIRGQVTGPDAAALLANCQAYYDQARQAAGVTGGRPLGGVDVAEQAFRWVAYTPAAAIVDLVSAGPGAQGTTIRASTQIQVIWDGGDWKVIAPPGGNWGNSAAGLPSLAGYTLFPGQGGER